MTKYHAKDTLLIQTTGVEIELDLVIEYSVSKYRSATLTQPEEPRSVDIETITCTWNGLLAPLPVWLEDRLDNDEFKARLLEEAADKDAAAAEDAAEYRRELAEDRL